MNKSKSESVVVAVKGVSKYFRPSASQKTLKEVLTTLFRKTSDTHQGYWANKDIDFEVEEGEFFGIVGKNGSGKSTLLKMIAGVYSPTKGEISVKGRLVPFIELGVGFNPELSGRDNVFLNGALLGFTRKEMELMYDEIVQFAELSEHMEVKLKNYSSGMQVRLAFSIAIRADSDILLIDEVLAVGDVAFQQKCFQYFMNLKRDKKTVILVTHDMSVVRRFCTRVAYISDSGLHIGTPEKIASMYLRKLTTKGETDSGSDDRWGNRHAVIRSPKVSINDTNIEVTYDVEFESPVDKPIFGIAIKNQFGQSIVETNTLWKRISTASYQSKDICRVEWKFPNIFTNGTHAITLAVSEQDGITFNDWWSDALSFSQSRDSITSGLILCEGDFSVKKRK